LVNNQKVEESRIAKVGNRADVGQVVRIKIEVVYVSATVQIGEVGDVQVVPEKNV
jgi:hypothetical protein